MVRIDTTLYMPEDLYQSIQALGEATQEDLATVLLLAARRLVREAEGDSPRLAVPATSTVASSSVARK